MRREPGRDTGPRRAGRLVNRVSQRATSRLPHSGTRGGKLPLDLTSSSSRRTLIKLRNNFYVYGNVRLLILKGLASRQARRA